MFKSKRILISLIFSSVLISLLIGGCAYNNQPIELPSLNLTAKSPNRLLWVQTELDGEIGFFRPKPIYNRNSTKTQMAVYIKPAACTDIDCSLAEILESQMSQYLRLTGDESTHLQQIMNAGNVLPVRQEESMLIASPIGCEALANAFYLGSILPHRQMIVAINCDGQRFVVSSLSIGRYRQRNDSIVETLVRSIQVTP